MIKNERQYRISKVQLQKFKDSIAKLEQNKKTSMLHPLLIKAQKDSLDSQLVDLQKQMQEYEELKSGKISVVDLFSIEDLPTSLIKARIALRLSQKELGNLVGLQEQQIQRYESRDYESASVGRMMEIIKALNSVGGKLTMPNEKLSTNNFFKKMTEIGLSRKFVLQRLLPPSLSERLQRSDLTNELFNFQAAAHVGRIFGWKPDQFFSSEPLLVNSEVLAQVRFKVPKQVNPLTLNVYTLYARYIALLVSQTVTDLPIRKMPTDPYEMHKSIVSQYGSITFQNLLRYVWKLGIPVIALDPGSFHSACLRDDDRSIIIMTQKTMSEARWMFNLIHEYYHAAIGKEQIVESEEELRSSDEEREASQFADIVLLGKDPNDLASRCLDEAGSIPNLKHTVEKISKEEEVRSDVLANYLAFRLSSEQNKSWWGTAENLQKQLDDARVIIRDTILEHSDFNSLSKPDLELLQQTLDVREMIINE